MNFFAKIISCCALERSSNQCLLICTCILKKGKEIHSKTNIIHVSYCFRTNRPVGKHHLSKIKLTSHHLLQSQLSPLFSSWQTRLSFYFAISWFKLPVGCLKWACTVLYWTYYYSWFLCSLWTTSLLRNSLLQSSSGVWDLWTALHGAFELCLLSTALCMAKKRNVSLKHIQSSA